MIPSIGQVDVLVHHPYDRSWLLFFRSSFGTWKIPVGHTTTDRVDQAISVGFSHIGKTLTLFINIQNSPNAVFSIFFDTLGNDKKKDTAQVYRNEAEAGLAIRDSGLERHDIFITTKYGGLDGLDIETSIQNSLKNVCAFFFLFLRRMITADAGDPFFKYRVRYYTVGSSICRFVPHPLPSTGCS